MIAAIVERDAPSVADVAPPLVDAVLRKCLAKDPEERWQSARDVRHALELAHGPPPVDQSTPTTTRMLSVALLVVLGAAAAFGAAWWTTRSQPAAELRTLSFHLTSPPEAEFQFAAAAGGSVIAPDGRSAAFVAVRNGTPRLWIRSLESSDGRELEDTDGARQPFWSPDSRSIGFFAGGDLRRVDVSGGTVSTLAPAPEPRGGAWTTDDTIVFSATSAGALQRVSASTGGTRFQLTWFSPEGVVLNTVGTVDRYASLRLSPDGKEALIVIDDASRKRDLWRFDLTGGTRSRVTSGGCGSFAVWSPDGQQIVYSSLLGKELEATSARGAVQVENLWNADTVVYPADVSRDGGRLAYVATHPETGFDIWQLEMKGHASAFRSCGRRSRNTIRSSHLTSSGWCTRRPKVDWKRSTCRPFLTRVAGSYPQWGRDGRAILYRAADGRLMRRRVQPAGAALDLGPPSVVTRLPDAPALVIYPYDVASDGRILALTLPGGGQGLALNVLMNWQTALERADASDSR